MQGTFIINSVLIFETLFLSSLFFFHWLICLVLYQYHFLHYYSFIRRIGIWWSKSSNHTLLLKPILDLLGFTFSYILQDHLSKAFSVEMITSFFSFNLLMWWVKLIYFQILKHTWVPGINSTWSWCIICFIYTARLSLLKFYHFFPLRWCDWW